MHIEQIHVGQSVTVVDGDYVLCQAGCCVLGERYSELKGVPIVVKGIAPPYLVCALPQGHTHVIIDSRACVLTKVSSAYRKAFLPVQRLAKPLEEIVGPQQGPHDPPHDGVCSGK
jgi:hypothetical protein